MKRNKKDKEERKEKIINLNNEDTYFGNHSCAAFVISSFFIGPFSLIFCCFPIDKKRTRNFNSNPNPNNNNVTAEV